LSRSNGTGSTRKSRGIGYAFPDRAELTTAIEILAEVLANQL
jgi:hypothetical protein